MVQFDWVRLGCDVDGELQTGGGNILSCFIQQEQSFAHQRDGILPHLRRICHTTHVPRRLPCRDRVAVNNLGPRP